MASTFVFDGPSPVEEPYDGPPLLRGSSWPASRQLLDTISEEPAPRREGGKLRVGIHATASAVASHRLGDSMLDLVFIDAAHDLKAVETDLRMWWPKLRDGGILAGHDFSMSCPGVMQ